MRGHLQLLMKWERYRYEKNSWVLEQDVAALDKLHEFYWTHPGAPHQSCLMAFQSMYLMLQGHSMLEGVMSGDAPFHISVLPNSTPPPVRTPPCPQVRLHSTPLLEFELHSTFRVRLCSTFTSRATVDVKQLTYKYPGSVRGLHNVGSVCTK